MHLDPISKSSTEPHFVTKREAVEEKYFAGLDLGQTSDPSALAVLRRVRHLVKYDDARWKDATPPIFQLGYLERYPLHTPYPGICHHVAELLQRPIWKDNISLAIDQTGCGRPVADIFRSAGVTFVGVNITSGLEERRDGNEVYVPKTTLISLMQAKLHEGVLHLHSELASAPDLRRELENFQVRYTDSGRLTFGASGSNKDDMTLALCIALHRSTIREHEPARFITSFHMSR